MAWRIWIALFISLGYACGPELPALPDDRGHDIQVSVEPLRTQAQLARVTRFTVRGKVSDNYPRLFVGELSPAQLRGAGSRPLSQALAKRLVRSHRAQRERSVRLAPVEVLTAGQELTLVVGPNDFRRYAVESEVPEAQSDVLFRLFPEESPAGTFSVFCGSELAATLGEAYERSQRLELPGEQGSLEIELMSVAAMPDCIRVEVRGGLPRYEVLGPLSMGGWLFEPTILMASSEVSHALQCAQESPFGPGCARVEDDRIIVAPPDVETFWFVDSTPPIAIAARASEPFVLTGLVPDSSFSLELTVFDEAGRNYWAKPVVQTGSLRDHVAINEVMADPLGPEPAQEWVELVNHGTSRVNLGEYRLEDSGGGTVLPAYELGPGRTVLVVPEQFDTSRLVVPVPELDKLLLRVTRLGQSGLANYGEPLRLVSLSGKVISSFPGEPKPEPGVSFARRVPWALDDNPNSFSYHESPGASPGAPNELRPSD